MRKVILAGGGSAGHTSPLLATAAALTGLDSNLTVVALGTPRGLENRVIPTAGYHLERVVPVPLPRKLNADLLRLPVKLGRSVAQAREIFRRHQPAAVVGFGGYVSVPAYLAAASMRIPIVVHEGNAIPGVANKIGAKLTKHVVTSFPQTELPNACCLGLPIRAAVAELSITARAQGLADFDLQDTKPTLLVTGGSQGALSINQAVQKAAPKLVAAGIQILHIVGPKAEISDLELAGYRLVKFVDQMELAYAVADLVLCRAGSNTVVEVAGLGIPAIFVPLPHGNGEQAVNAQPVLEAGGGVLIADRDLTPELVAKQVTEILLTESKRLQMSNAARTALPTGADQKLAKLILQVIS